jgi:hypothetical protein
VEIEEGVEDAEEEAVDVDVDVVGEIATLSMLELSL